MCSAILEIIEPKLKENWNAGFRQGYIQGYIRGYVQGYAKGEACTKKVFRMDREGKSPEKIAAACGITEEKVRELLYD